ncbi:hypothetical protein HK104_010221 [Borealophlyctis nickersoniae]|nr:hypothetical protein HK104_010221 [Borealophlyctis nickersoniae]
MSPFDPLFVLLPVMDRARKKTSGSHGMFLALDDLLHDEAWPGLMKLGSLEGIEEMVKVLCDVNDVGGVPYYRLNDANALRWLRAKADALLGRFEEYTFFEVARYRERSMSDAEKQETRTRTVVRVLSDCLSQAWQERLLESYGLQSLDEIASPPAPNPATTMREEEEEEPTSAKRPLTERNKDSKRPTKKKKLTPAQNALAKADITGMKSISSFFGKK